MAVAEQLLSHVRGYSVPEALFESVPIYAVVLGCGVFVQVHFSSRVQFNVQCALTGTHCHITARAST